MTYSVIVTRKAKNFVLIDLVSQRDAVRAFLDGVDVAARLEWLRSWGELHTITERPPFPASFVFESRLGLRAGFFFDEAGDFVFVGDNCTFR